MIKSILKYSLLYIVPFTLVCNLYATSIPPKADSSALVYLFELHQEINPAASRITERAIAEAEKISADYIVLDLNTYGGLVDDADKIRTALLNTKIPTMVFIRNNAASAGALISIACDSIYMKEGATIGAAAVVNQEGEVMPEKYQSYMRNKMRATAEATNRNADIAEAMVDPKIKIKNISTENEIITFSVEEAIENNYCEGKVETIDDLLQKANIYNAKIEKHKVSSIEKIIAFFINPAVAGFLLLIIMGGIYFELQSPGVGFPIAAAIIAALLYFTPHYLEGLAAHWEILLFAVGIILLAVEMFVLPGFGIAGVLGLVITVGGLILSLVRNLNGFDFSFVPQNELASAFLTVSSILFIGVISLFFGGDKIMSTLFQGKIGLKSSQSKEKGFIISEVNKLNKFVGESAIAATDLRPAGKIEIQNEYIYAQSDGEYITKGTKVKVLKTLGAYLLVEKEL